MFIRHENKSTTGSSISGINRNREGNKGEKKETNQDKLNYCLTVTLDIKTFHIERKL